jgi:hypothetical protein
MIEEAVHLGARIEAVEAKAAKERQEEGGKAAGRKRLGKFCLTYPLTSTKPHVELPSLWACRGQRMRKPKMADKALYPPLKYRDARNPRKLPRPF